MKGNPKIKNIIFRASAVLILVAALLYNFSPDVARYVMIAGSIGFIASIFTMPYPGKSIRGKRLFNYQVFVGILFGVSSYLMYIANSGWVVVLLIGALILLYTTYMLDRVYRQEQEEKNK